VTQPLIKFTKYSFCQQFGQCWQLDERSVGLVYWCVSFSKSLCYFKSL